MGQVRAVNRKKVARCLTIKIGTMNAGRSRHGSLDMIAVLGSAKIVPRYRRHFAVSDH